MDTTEDDVQAATKDAFDNWKVIYNTSLVMTYGRSTDLVLWSLLTRTRSIIRLSGMEDLQYSERLDRRRSAAATYPRFRESPLPRGISQTNFFRQLLIALHVWSAASSYEVLGDFGKFFCSRRREQC